MPSLAALALLPLLGGAALAAAVAAPSSSDCGSDASCPAVPAAAPTLDEGASDADSALLQLHGSAHVGALEAAAPGWPEIVEPATVYSENGYLSTTLFFDVASFSWPELGLKVTTRVYNYSFPGPTIRIKRGDRLEVTLVNRLTAREDNSTPVPRREGWMGINKTDTGLYENVGQVDFDKTRMYAHLNNFHFPNKTNLHTHGFHVSQLSPEDNVLQVMVEEGKNYTYEYDFSAYHSGGSSWYHPHLHAAVTLQTAGGAVGAILTDDSPGELPDEIANIESKVMVIQENIFDHFGPEWEVVQADDPAHGCMPFGSVYSSLCWQQGRTPFLANLSNDDVFKVELLPGFGFGAGLKKPIRHFFTVNGQFQPQISLKTASWIRMRLIFAGHLNAINLVMTGQDSLEQASECEMQLIGKDNVYLPKLPRRITKGAWLAPGGRAQVLVRCKKAGVYALRQALDISKNGFPTQASNQTLVYLRVAGRCSGRACGQPLKEVISLKPRYQQSLLDYPLDKVAKPYALNQRMSNFTMMLLYDDGHTLNQNQVLDAVGKKVQGDEPKLTPANADNSDDIPNGDVAWKMWPKRFTMNNQTFIPPTYISEDQSKAAMADMAYQALVPMAQVVQFAPGGLQAHAWHMHTNPVQFFSFANKDYQALYGGFFEVGDWHDTIMLPLDKAPFNNVTVRFHTDCYSGPLVIHCHILPHEDIGMFTLVYARGKNHQVNKEFDNQGIFRSPPQQCMRRKSRCPPPFCTTYPYQ